MTFRVPLPRLDQLCPYCAAYPSMACAEAQPGLWIYAARVHVGDPAFLPLLALDRLLEGLRDFAASMAARPGASPCP